MVAPLRGIGRVIAVVVLAGAACGSVAPVAAAAPPGDVLVTSLGEGGVPAGSRQVARIAGLRFSTVPVPAGLTAGSYAAALRRRSGILAAQANTPIRRASIAGTCVDTPTAPSTATVDAVNARSRALPATTGPIAVLDTGVDPTVPELAGRVLPGSNALVGAAPPQADDDGHGTQVAAAAAGAPGLVAGISPTSPIMPIRVATASVLATPSNIVIGLEIAVKRKARVAVLPSSQPLADTSKDTVTSVGLAVKAALSGGVLTVVPAGNEGQNEPIFPGALSHVLTVGSAAATGARDDFSNKGPWIDLVAPGADLVLPAPPSLCLSGYARASGTSFSAAAVAGAVALIAAARPTARIGSLFDIVRRLAAKDAAPGGFDVSTGYGLLDVGRALGASAGSSDPYEVNDDVYWFQERSKAFPTYLRRTRVTTTRATVSPGKDPQDAFRVYVRKGQVLRARVTNFDSKAVLYASIWSTRTRAFDMGLSSPSTELRDSGGFTQSPYVSYRATKTGNYYVGVFAPQWTVPGEQGTIGLDLAPLSSPRTTYRLTVKRG